ncbi:hypothetical protein GCM10028825_26000 [Spirosoma agri]
MNLGVEAGAILSFNYDNIIAIKYLIIKIVVHLFQSLIILFSRLFVYWGRQVYNYLSKTEHKILYYITSLLFKCYFITTLPLQSYPDFNN